MMRSLPFAAGVLLLVVATPSVPQAQANQIPGTDVSLGALGGLAAMGREGAYPDGANGIAISTTSCNVGSVDVPWLAPMLADHPLIAFLVAREENGRMEQISDYSFVKHGFYALTNSLCDSCTLGPFGGGIELGIGCSDTYGTGNNGDNYYLGPASEIDPWLGTWEPVCSYFDAGDPVALPPLDCDGIRSLSIAQAQAFALGVGHRMRVTDADLESGPGSSYYYQGQYVIRGEPTENRWNNIGSQEFLPTWNPSKDQFEFSTQGELVLGSVLNRWSGASVASAGDGQNDGTLVVAVKVTGPVAGRYHYEYAVHDLDYSRSAGELHIPICDGARIFDAGFRDLDDDPGNDWQFTQAAGEVVFSTGDNPVRWNSIYNFWFDSDAAPASGAVSVVGFSPGPGPALGFGLEAPLALFNPFLGEGCSNATVPSLYATGTPPRATLGNASFALESAGNDPNGIAVLFVGAFDGLQPIGGGCNLYMAGLVGTQILPLVTSIADATGLATFPVPIPNQASLEGSAPNLQTFSLRLAGGPAIGLGDLSDALEVRIGDSLPNCP